MGHYCRVGDFGCTCWDYFLSLDELTRLKMMKNIFYKLVMAVGGLSNATRTPQGDSYCILKKQIYNLTTCLHC